MRPGPDGLVGAAVVNRAAGLGVFQRYDPATLPRHITWRQLGTVAYVVAMEPSTNRDAGRFDARERGELISLAPGEERRYRLEIGALDGRDAIEAFAAGARELAGGPRMNPAVPKLSAGVITADLTKLGVELEILRGKAAWAHVDVMDGTFSARS